MRSFALSGGAGLRYVERPGAGVPLLMLHGLGCASTADYPAVIAAPALRERTVWLVDLPGHGASDAPEGFGFTVADHAAAVARLVAALGVAELDLYGHSMGGAVAIEAAERIGAGLRALVLSEANLDPGGGVFSRAIAAQSEADYVAHGHRETVAAARASGNAGWAATMACADPRAVHRGATSLVAGAVPSWRDRLLAVAARRAFLFGARSLPDPDAAALAAAGIAVLTVPDAGHGMAGDNPAGLAEAIAAGTG